MSTQHLGEGEHFRIVIIEEHEMIRHALRSLLEVDGFEVVADTADVIEAPELISSLRADGVVLDWRIRGTPSGPETLAYLRRHAPMIPVVVYTAYPDRTFGQAATLGASDVVIKSLSNRQDLSAALNKAINRSREVALEHRRRRLIAVEGVVAVHERAAEFYRSFGLHDRATGEAKLADEARRRLEDKRQ